MIRHQGICGPVLLERDGIDEAGKGVGGIVGSFWLGKGSFFLLFLLSMVPRFDEESSSWIDGQSQHHTTELHNQLSFIKMRGFMCRSVEVTSGCKLRDTGNVVVPSLVLGKNEGLSTRLIELEKVRFGERQEANASRRSMSLIPKPSGSKRSGQGHVDTSSEIAMRMAPRTVNASDDVFQVVVMRVSLHCQGCAGKLKKHLARMEGVTSFSIDLEEKRVTVRGRVLPARVLESISKVKRAEFWTSFHDQLIN